MDFSIIGSIHECPQPLVNQDCSFNVHPALRLLLPSGNNNGTKKLTAKEIKEKHKKDMLEQVDDRSDTTYVKYEGGIEIHAPSRECEQASQD